MIESAPLLNKVRVEAARSMSCAEGPDEGQALRVPTRLHLAASEEEVIMLLKKTVESRGKSSAAAASHDDGRPKDVRWKDEGSEPPRAKTAAFCRRAGRSERSCKLPIPRAASPPRRRVAQALARQTDVDDDNELPSLMGSHLERLLSAEGSAASTSSSRSVGSNRQQQQQPGVLVPASPVKKRTTGPSFSLLFALSPPTRLEAALERVLTPVSCLMAGQARLIRLISRDHPVIGATRSRTAGSSRVRLALARHSHFKPLAISS